MELTKPHMSFFSYQTNFRFLKENWMPTTQPVVFEKTSKEDAKNNFSELQTRSWKNKSQV